MDLEKRREGRRRPALRLEDVEERMKRVVVFFSERVSIVTGPRFGEEEEERRNRSGGEKLSEGRIGLVCVLAGKIFFFSKEKVSSLGIMVCPSRHSPSSIVPQCWCTRGGER